MSSSIIEIHKKVSLMNLYKNYTYTNIYAYTYYAYTHMYKNKERKMWYLYSTFCMGRCNVINLPCNFFPK